jgi:hypothetical protein
MTITAKLKRGDKLICIDAKETSIQLVEGEVYTVRRVLKTGRQVEDYTGDFFIPATAAELPAVVVEEIGGCYMNKRFALHEPTLTL